MKYEVISKSFDLKTDAGNCDAHLFRPSGEGKFPGILLFMDAFGPRPYLFEMATKLSSHGYIVLVPNLLYRDRKAPLVDLSFPLSPEDMPAATSQVIPLARAFNVEEGVKDVAFYLACLSEQDGFSGQVGITGYCMGGSLAIRSAAKYSESIQAVASFHAGNLASDAPNSPHLLLPLLKCRLYVAHADHDKSMPVEQIARFEDALKRVSIPAESELYAGASHGFTMADLPAYNPSALERHWHKLFDLFSSFSEK